MKIKKFLFIFIFLSIISTFLTISYARYVGYKSVELDLNVSANSETGIIDFGISTSKNIYVVNSDTEINENNSDMNGDKKINITDALLLKKKILD